MVNKLIVILFAVLALSGCRKKGVGTEEESALSFSTSEVFFDTIFTGIGSATQFFKVYNPSDKDVKISKVFLEQGTSSQFRFNLDGINGEQNDITIAGNDSAFCFIEVTVNTGNKNNPFILEDNLIFITNGQTQKVKTVAWGQDAYYYFANTTVEGLPSFSRITDYKYQPAWNDVITWKNDKPHVIYGYLRVDSSFTLKIEKGTQVHFHEGAGLWVATGGSIEVDGEKDEEVVFQGDRIEEAFDERPGQWDRIWINEGGNSSFTYAIIKNAYIGIQAETTPFDPSAIMSDNPLKLQKTIIKNMVGVGIYTQNYIIEAENCLIYDIGNQDLAIAGGGDFSFKHCTFANYWSGGNRQQSLLYLSNRYRNYFGNIEDKDLKAKFENCIFYGNKDEEIELDSSKKALYEIVFDHCLLKTEIDTNTNLSRFINCVTNPFNGFNSPVFTSPGSDEYLLYSGSSAQDKGNPNVIGGMLEASDLLMINRDPKPDIGCYEFEK